MTEPTIGPDTIVVGVDGSATAERALEWAVDEARLRHFRLRVVQAIDPVLSGMSSPFGAAEALAAEEDAARAILADLVRRNCAGIEVTAVTRVGRPGGVLVDEARSAALLVVGSRGRGAVRRAMLGSTSTFCAHHSVRPVVIVTQGDAAAA